MFKPLNLLQIRQNTFLEKSLLTLHSSDSWIHAFNAYYWIKFTCLTKLLFQNVILSFDLGQFSAPIMYQGHIKISPYLESGRCSHSSPSAQSTHCPCCSAQVASFGQGWYRGTAWYQIWYLFSEKKFTRNKFKLDFELNF